MTNTKKASYSGPICDCHCHVYPDRIAEKASAGIGAFYGLDMHYNGTVSDLLASGEAAGVTHHVVCSVATKPEQVRPICDFLASVAATDPKRIKAFGTAHPQSETPAEDMDYLLGRGLIGVKMHPDIQRFALDSEESIRLGRICAERGLPLLLHTGDSRYSFSNPENVLALMKACPGLSVIGAHFGAYSLWDDESCRRLADNPLFSVDCSSSFNRLTDADILRLVRTYGAERVCFGTDYPIWPPRGEIDRLLGCGITDAEAERILWKNAAERFGFGDPDTRGETAL